MCKGMGSMNREQKVPESADAYSKFLHSLRQQRAQRKAGITKHRRKALSRSERDAILGKTAGKCHICGGEIAGDWEADHVLAYAGGGVHSIDNYLAAIRFVTTIAGTICLMSFRRS